MTLSKTRPLCSRWFSVVVCGSIANCSGTTMMAEMGELSAVGWRTWAEGKEEYTTFHSILVSEL
jgi:hypothetical protein